MSLGMIAAIAAAVLALLFVLGRLLRIGCRLVLTMLYFLVLLASALLLLSFLYRTGLFDELLR